MPYRVSLWLPKFLKSSKCCSFLPDSCKNSDRLVEGEKCAVDNSLLQHSDCCGRLISLDLLVL